MLQRRNCNDLVKEPFKDGFYRRKKGRIHLLCEISRQASAASSIHLHRREHVFVTIQQKGRIISSAHAIYRINQHWRLLTIVIVQLGLDHNSRYSRAIDSLCQVDSICIQRRGLEPKLQNAFLVLSDADRVATVALLWEGREAAFLEAAEPVVAGLASDARGDEEVGSVQLEMF